MISDVSVTALSVRTSPVAVLLLNSWHSTAEPTGVSFVPAVKDFSWSNTENIFTVSGM
jgi:hypothetical protein